MKSKIHELHKIKIKPVSKTKILLFISMLCFTYSVNGTSLVLGDTNKTNNAGKKVGLWKEKTSQNECYGNYEEGKKEGQWVCYHANGVVSNIGQYKNGMLNGVYMILLPGFYHLNNRSFSLHPKHPFCIQFLISILLRSDKLYFCHSMCRLRSSLSDNYNPIYQSTKQFHSTSHSCIVQCY